MVEQLESMGVPAQEPRDRGALPVTLISGGHSGREALRDVLAGCALWQLWLRLAFHDIRQRFRRSVLGPLWITLSTGIMIAALGMVFSALFGQDVGHTLPYVAAGLICWGLLTAAINEGANVFIGNESYLKNVPLPVSLHVFRMMARNLIIWGFNMAIYVAVLVWFRMWPGWPLLLFVPGFALFLVNATWMGLVAGILSTRFRDIPQVISNLVQVVFFVTPVFWSTETLSRRPAFVDWNPLYHVLELARAPLLGEVPSLRSWLFGIGLAVVGLAAAAYLYRRAYARLPYWV